ncbi:MAG: hypothetical protein IPH55_06550 [Betaproteobacteria bacterium]|nr:hypothetical protein [Betaproteobacteria bacterium]
MKNKYAVRFADEMGRQIAEDLEQKLPGIGASAARSASSARGRNNSTSTSTPELGLALGISLKSVHLREESGSRRYTHNMKRNEEELRIEAAGYHKRQPYAVMIGVLFLPFDSCDDARGDNTSSSFGSWVRHLRPYAGRAGPHDEQDRLEKIYIALYEPDGSVLLYFDVEADPPKNTALTGWRQCGSDGRLRRLLSYQEFLDAAYHEYLRRNSLEFRWADGIEEPQDPSDAS